MPCQPSITIGDIYKKATLIVNGRSSGMGMRMFEDILHKQKVDILLLKVVNHNEFDMLMIIRRARI
jgi:ribosomal protein S6E (S10)